MPLSSADCEPSVCRVCALNNNLRKVVYGKLCDGVAFFGNRMGHDFTGLFCVHHHLVVASVDLNLCLRIQAQYGFFDCHFAMPAGHALNLKSVFHKLFLIKM